MSSSLVVCLKASAKLSRIIKRCGEDLIRHCRLQAHAAAATITDSQPQIWSREASVGGAVMAVKNLRFAHLKDTHLGKWRMLGAQRLLSECTYRIWNHQTTQKSLVRWLLILGAPQHWYLIQRCNEGLGPILKKLDDSMVFDSGLRLPSLLCHATQNGSATQGLNFSISQILARDDSLTHGLRIPMRRCTAYARCCG